MYLSYTYNMLNFSLILESQKVKQQLRHLEKKINDLKVMRHDLNSEKCKNIQFISCMRVFSWLRKELLLSSQRANGWRKNCEWSRRVSGKGRKMYEIGAIHMVVVPALPPFLGFSSPLTIGYQIKNIMRITKQRR